MTRALKLKADKQKITSAIMKEMKVTVREFLRNFKKLSNKKKTIIIQKNGTPEGVYVPYKEWEKTEGPIKLTVELIDKYSFGGGDPDLSQKIDEIVYTYPNKLKNDNT